VDAKPNPWRKALRQIELNTSASAGTDTVLGKIYALAHEALAEEPGDDNLRQENNQLRQIISDCSTALPNGSYIGPDAPLHALKDLRGEILLMVAIKADPPAPPPDPPEDVDQGYMLVWNEKEGLWDATPVP
jgi:hypothetical protein